MRVVVASCYKYRDAWKPFVALFRKFFDERPITLLTDEVPEWLSLDLTAPDVIIEEEQGTWCQMLAKFAAKTNEPILLFQEDFFLNQKVNHDVIQHAMDCLEYQIGVSCVRLYPCPGGDMPSIDPYFAPVNFNHQYRISCQAAIWKPSYLSAVADYADGGPWDFELIGSPYSRTLIGDVLAFKRELKPWPVEYICSAISRGQWNPDAKKLCDREGIEVDWSMRPFAAA